MLAFGDSITNGGGELQWGVALQSWALWVARGLGAAVHRLRGRRCARATTCVRRADPGVRARDSADPGARYDLGCLYIGVNDVRAPDWDAVRFEQDFRARVAVPERPLRPRR